MVDAADFQMGKTNTSPEFLAKFPLGKVPAFEGADGFCLTEGGAIARYVAASGPRAEQLLGRDAHARAKIDEWSFFADTELGAHMTPGLLMTFLKMIPFDEARYNQAAADFERALKRLDVGIKVAGGGGKFLVGDELTLADIMVAGPLVVAGHFLLDDDMRKAAPNVEPWLRELLAIPELGAGFGELQLCGKRLK